MLNKNRINLYANKMKMIDMEWDSSTFGYISIPVFFMGVVFCFFPDILYKWFVFWRYRTVKPNWEFEDNPPSGDIPIWVEVMLKICGSVMMILGIVWFWFAEEFYEFWF
ncbi:hypothetical protein MH215_19150 [Paenibacillus sp. ACRSA]|uniref:hypothetical protein n=1 Tax=Paenibacillus sp. ACRSA TaxID=2918211 RepID=UPI001EF56E07|nr:hypothetical protein [Paenibacillus sp. ACRSA]MCG7379136.1 hypothetical protein [Paenibacillus sp. ACRSA]